MLTKLLGMITRAVGARHASPSATGGRIGTAIIMHPLEGRQLLSAAPMLVMPAAFGLVNITLSDSQVAEGNSGNTTAYFTVALNGLSTVPVAVQWSTADGSAHAGTDYVASHGDVRFSLGTRSAVIAVPVIGNTIQDGNRVFYVNLNTPVGAPIARGQGAGTIIDDDLPQVSIVVRQAKASENAKTPGVLRISRTGATDNTLKVNYTVSGTGKKGVDYLALPGVATIPAGQAYVDVIVRPVVDNLIKSTNVVVKLSADAGYFLTSKSSGAITIIDDEKVPPAAFLLTAPPITIATGQAYQFTVRYTDNKAMDAATVGTGCLRVTGPGGYTRDAQLVSKTLSTNGRAVLAIYSILPPGGSWDSTDNGSYIVNVLAGKVRDKAGNSLTAGGLGTIQVNIPAPHA